MSDGPRPPRRPALATRLSLALALLLLGFGSVVALLAVRVASEREQEALQRLSHGLARHIVEHWPEVKSAPDRDVANRAARDAVIAKLMAVNPGIQVYVLDAQGRVEAYLGEPGMVRESHVDIDAVRAFVGGAALPLHGTDPMGGTQRRVFSAARFPPRSGESSAGGYLYVVLDGSARKLIASELGTRGLWLGIAGATAIGLALVGAAGVVVFGRLTRPLRRLARRMHDHRREADGTDMPSAGDEVQAINDAFEAMVRRIELQALREHEQAAAHRETVAGVAHDLRTPLTALHGQLEALALADGMASGERDKRLRAALDQSDRVRRLSQQLFELAALQSTDVVLHRERFRLEDVVTDTVQKFELAPSGAAVWLQATRPERLELEGDLQLIERAITNLIDNAIRHAPSREPVRVSVEREGLQARVLVEDQGPGLPAELMRRLDRGDSLRDPPLARPGGGIGGLGLAIAQRVAVLHGGTLRPLPAPGGGTRLCLMLPLAG